MLPPSELDRAFECGADFNTAFESGDMPRAPVRVPGPRPLEMIQCLQPSGVTSTPDPPTPSASGAVSSDSAPPAATALHHRLEAGMERYLGDPLPQSGYQAPGGRRPDWQRLASHRHDAQKWCQAFEAAGDGTKNPNMFMIRGLRELIWRQTLKVVERLLRPPCEQNVPVAANPAQRTEVIDGRRIGRAAGPSGEPKDIKVLQTDMLEAAAQLVEGGHSVAVLNMASAGSPGGGVQDGAGAQEENLHRRTDLFRYTLEQRNNYPIPPEACLLSKDVTIMRGTEKDGYPFLSAMPRVSVLSCAAISHPRLDRRNCYSYRDDHQLMQMKAAVILQAAAQARCSMVVLSAFGCGAFGNPPQVVAEIFKEALQRSSVKGAIFCIFDDHNAGHAHNPQGNFRPFCEVFQQRSESL